MHLVRLIYASTKTQSFKPEDIEDILEKARKFNGQHGVTGMLCFNRNFFLQCLEGGRTAVNMTYQKILKDERHDHVVILGYEEIVYRDFNDWSMAYVPEQMLTDDINLRYSKGKTFDPYAMNGDSAALMLLELSEHIKAV